VVESVIDCVVDDVEEGDEAAVDWHLVGCKVSKVQVEIQPRSEVRNFLGVDIIFFVSDLDSDVWRQLWCRLPVTETFVGLRRVSRAWPDAGALRFGRVRVCKDDLVLTSISAEEVCWRCGRLGPSMVRVWLCGRYFAYTEERSQRGDLVQTQNTDLHLECGVTTIDKTFGEAWTQCLGSPSPLDFRRVAFCRTIEEIESYFS
jgi:hypothetical protein